MVAAGVSNTPSGFFHTEEIAGQGCLDLKQPSVAVLSRVGKIYRETLEHPGGLLADYKNVLRKEYGFRNAVSYEENRLSGLSPDPNQLSTHLSSSDFIKSTEGFVHQ